jgi:hypothetical protein
LGPTNRPADWDESRIQLIQLFNEARARDVMQIGYILTDADLDNAIEPADERIVDSEDEIINNVAMSYSQCYDEDEEIDLEGHVISDISMSDLSKSLDVVIRGLEQAQEVDYGLVLQLQKQQKGILQRVIAEREASQEQQPITRYFLTS